MQHLMRKEEIRVRIDNATSCNDGESSTAVDEIGAKRRIYQHGVMSLLTHCRLRICDILGCGMARLKNLHLREKIWLVVLWGYQA